MNAADLTVYFSFCPLSFWPIAPSLSLQKASLSNPHPHFSNCIQNVVTWVRCCLTHFCKRNNCILLSDSQSSNSSEYWTFRSVHFGMFILCFTYLNKLTIHTRHRGPVFESLLQILTRNAQIVASRQIIQGPRLPINHGRVEG